jgi:hypothetical protein
LTDGRPRRTRLAGLSALALALTALGLALAVLAVASPVAMAGWGAPFRFAQPGSLDTLPPSIAVSSAGAADVAFGIQDADDPADSEALVTARTAGGGVGAPLPIPGAQEVLGLTFDGSALELLTGTSLAGLECCSSAQAVSLNARGGFGRPRTLVPGLTGATLGQLLTLPSGGMLAVVATGLGVWVNGSARSNRFTSTHRLTSASVSPESVFATNLGAGRTAVAWTALSGPAGETVARSIMLATGSEYSAPGHVHTALTVPAGHGIDGLGLAPGATVPSAAWIESWSDRHGYHSQAKAADLTARPEISTLSLAGQLVSGLAFAGDRAGDLAAAWEACSSNGTCKLFASVRRVARPFTRPAALGLIDSSQTPAIAIAPNGQVLVGWVRSGHPVAAALAARSARFGAVHVLSSTIYAADLALAFGSTDTAIAAWTQGTLAPSVVGAAYRAP